MKNKRFAYIPEVPHSIFILHLPANAQNTLATRPLRPLDGAASVVYEGGNSINPASKIPRCARRFIRGPISQLPILSHFPDRIGGYFVNLSVGYIIPILFVRMQINARQGLDAGV